MANENALQNFHDFEDFHDIGILSRFDPNFLCRMCRKLLKNASQLICGCRFCFECIKSHFLTKPECPYGCLPCTNTQDQCGIVHDNATNKAIGELDVKCRYCEEKMSMNNMRGHLESCKPATELVKESGGEWVEESRRKKIRKDTRRFIIRKFNLKFKEAKELPEAGYYSKPFSICSGYQMQIVVYPNGNGVYRGSHMSVYYVLLKGDQDEDLEWPFCYEVAFSVERKHGKVGSVYSIKIPQEKNKIGNQKPEGENPKVGIGDFLPIENLSQFVDEEGLVMRFSVKVRC